MVGRGARISTVRTATPHLQSIAWRALSLTFPLASPPPHTLSHKTSDNTEKASRRSTKTFTSFSSGQERRRHAGWRRSLLAPVSHALLSMSVHLRVSVFWCSSSCTHTHTHTRARPSLPQRFTSTTDLAIESCSPPLSPFAPIRHINGLRKSH